jgi:hypothetical protein
MSPSKRIAALTALTVALMLMTTGASSAAPNARCLHAKGDTIVQSGSYRVYQVIKHQPKKYYTSLTTVYTCGLHRVHFLRRAIARWGNNLDGTLDVRDGQLAGDYALLRVEDETGVSDSIGLWASDLRHGSATQFYPSEDQAIGDTWLASDGGVLAVYSPNTTNATLHAFDSAGDHTLATGTFSESGVSSDNAYWIDAGVFHSFTFVGAAALAK